MGQAAVVALVEARQEDGRREGGKVGALLATEAGAEKREMRVRGIARVDRRTKRLAQRLGPGEIAVISHRDLDGPCARALVRRGAAAVVNAEASISGRYPNLGPEILLEAGIPLLDEMGPELMELVREGEVAEVVNDSLFQNGTLVARGQLLGEEEAARRVEAAKANLAGEMERFVQNTLSFVSSEQRLLFELPALPDLETDFRGRHALLVVRGEGAREDLQAIRSYVRGLRPVLVGVDGGADLLLEEGLRPDLIVGDMDSVSDRALRSGAEIIVHAYTDSRAPGMKRVEELGVKAKVFPCLGTSEDVALLLAFEKEADLIVAVGTHTSLVDFLEKARGGMASTFLVRLKVGGKLVDARGVSKLYPGPLAGKYFFYFALAALAAIISVLGYGPQITSYLHLLWLRLLSAFD